MSAPTALLRELCAYGLNLADSLGIEPRQISADNFGTLTLNVWGADPAEAHAALDEDGWPARFSLGSNHAAREHSTVLDGKHVKLRVVTDPIAGNFPHDDRQSW